MVPVGRGDQRAVLHHEEDVHAAQFLNRVVIELVQEEHLLAAVGLGFLLRDQRRGVVAAALAGAGSATPARAYSREIQMETGFSSPPK